MFSSVGSSGRSWPSWKTKPKRRRRRSDSTRSDMVVISSPSSVIDPELGRSTPARQCRSVVLPEPEGPMIATCVPCGSVRSTPASAWTGVFPRMYVFVSARVTRPALFSVMPPRYSRGASHFHEGLPWLSPESPPTHRRKWRNSPASTALIHPLTPACGTVCPHLRPPGPTTDRVGCIRSDCRNGTTPRRTPWVWKI